MLIEARILVLQDGEVQLIVYHSDVQTDWYNALEEFTKLSLTSNDINIGFYNTLVNFNGIIASLTNKIPLFIENHSIEILQNYFKQIEDKNKITADILFLWNYLFEYLSHFKEEHSNYNIELNDVGEMFDTILYYLETELEID